MDDDAVEGDGVVGTEGLVGVYVATDVDVGADVEAEGSAGGFGGMSLGRVEQVIHDVDVVFGNG